MNGKNIRIVGFGDSITEAVIGIPDERKRWLNILKRKLVHEFPSFNFEMINSGIGGNSARDAMARFEKDVLLKEPDFVILEFGGNNEDILHPERIVRIEEFRTHLDDYKRRLPSNVKTVIVTFPPVLDDLHAYGKYPEFAEHYRKAGGIDRTVDPYREMTRVFASENGYPLCDLYRKVLELSRHDGRLLYTLPDGVHLTETGNGVLACGLFEILKSMIHP